MSKKTAETNTPVVVTVDDITVATPVETETPEPRVSVFIPRNADDESGEKVDPYERVTINGEGTNVMRGEMVDVTIPVFVQLRNKFPKL